MTRGRAACHPPRRRRPARRAPDRRVVRPGPGGRSCRTNGCTRPAARSVRGRRRPGARPGTSARSRPGSRRAAVPWPGRPRPRCAADVAASAPGPAGGSSPGSVDTLRPTPTTTASPAASARIPASFRAGRASTSFGHFSRVGTPVTAVTAEATATPASSESQPRRASGTAAGRTSRENVSAARGGDTQVRPIRPRPAVCSSAASTTPSGAPASARASRSALVEPVRSSTSTACHRPPGRSTARRRLAASSGLRPDEVGWLAYGFRLAW